MSIESTWYMVRHRRGRISGLNVTRYRPAPLSLGVVRSMASAAPWLADYYTHEIHVEASDYDSAIRKARQAFDAHLEAGA